MDQHHVQISSSSISCGVIELSRIESDVKKVLYAIATYLYHPSRGTPAAFALWSDIVSGSNGFWLSHEIRKFFPRAAIWVTSTVENPKTGNPICVWVWEIPHEEFKKWYIDQRVERAKKL